MVSPEWFFSTLAQAAAASIGFVIAFAAALYSNRRAQQRERVNGLKQDIREFRENTGDVLDEMCECLREFGEFERENEIYREEAEPIEKSIGVEEWAEEQQTEKIAYVYINIRWLSWLLAVLDEATNPEEMREKLRELEHPVLNILNSFDTTPERHRNAKAPYIELYSELTADNDSAPTSYSKDYHIFGTRHYLNNYIRDHTPITESGATLRGWTAIVESIADSYYTISARKYLDSTLFEEDLVGPVLQRCKILFISSVILPTIFLLTMPETLQIVIVPDSIVLASQLVILGIIGVYGWRLFEDLISLVQTTEF